MRTARGAAFRRVAGVAAILAGMCGAIPAGAASIERVDAAQLDSLLRAGVPVVDIRRAEEWQQTGVIAGSMLITAFDGEGRLRPDFVARLRDAVGDGKPVALICRSGNRSAAAAKLLDAAGVTVTIYDVAGGVRDWASAGKALTPCPQC